jgi:hypothetical protein
MEGLTIVITLTTLRLVVPLVLLFSLGEWILKKQRLSHAGLR